MKVLHLIPTYLPGNFASGPIKPTHFLNRELVKKGDEVVVYTTNRDGREKLDVPINQEVNIDGVKVFYFRSFGPSFWYFSWGFWRAVANTINEFDVVHITSVFLAASTLGAYYARKFKKPYIISPHGSLMKEPLGMKSPLKKKIYIDLIEKRNLAGAAAIHFTVEIERAEYPMSGLSLQKYFVIPNAFDSEEFEKDPRQRFFRNKFNISTDKKIILFLGRINWKKGLDTLIPAFSEVVKHESKAFLVLAGPDDEGYKKNIQLLITNYQLQDKVVFTGMLVGEDKISAFRESDVFVLPSYSENFGMAVVEAMHFGLPVVITKGVGIADRVHEAGAGIVVDKDEKQLTEAILKVLSNPELGRQMGEAGQRLVKEEFSAPSIADRWIKVYNELIKK